MLAIAGGKGGTGKTTTALALARAFATAGRDRTAEVVVVDADLDMPDLHSMTGVPREPTVTVRPRGRRVPELPGVRVAPAPRQGGGAPSESTTAESSAVSDPDSGGIAIAEDGGTVGHLEACLRTLRDDRDGLVLVDSPCGAGPDATRPVDIADGVVLVTRPTPAAVQDTLKTAEMAGALDTPIVGCAVVGRRPPRSLSAVFGVDEVTRIPFVDGDPLETAAVRTAAMQLAMDCTARQTPF